MAFLAAFHANALSDVCTLESGLVTAPTTQEIACLPLPTQDIQDDAAVRLLIRDAEQTTQIGQRVVFCNTRYLIKTIQHDPKTGFARLICVSWTETAV